MARFRTDSTLVLVPVTVTDHRGATVSGLASEVFAVFDDRLPQLILSFNEQDVPYSVGVIFDVSGSMKDKLPQAKAALRTFLHDANVGDEAMLMSVSDGPSLRTRFTRDFGSLLEASSVSSAGGNTALVDTIYLGLTHMRRARNSRKALLVISDGIDNQSRYSTRELMSAALEADVQVHTLAIGESSGNRKGI
jgi:Ca-activated chloride channel family protein